MVVFEQPGGDQPLGCRVLGGIAERVAGAVLRRTGEGTVQHRGSGKIDGIAGVPQAAADLSIAQQAVPRPELVVVVPDTDESLAKVREGDFEVLQGVDRSGQRPLEPAGELRGGARFPDAGEHRFHGTVIGGPVAVQRVDRTAPRVTGRVPVLPVPDDPAGPVIRGGACPDGRFGGPVAQAVVSAAAASG